MERTEHLITNEVWSDQQHIIKKETKTSTLSISHKTAGTLEACVLWKETAGDIIRKTAIDFH